MRLLLFTFLFVASCSIKDRFSNDQPAQGEALSPAFAKIDINKDNEISQEEFLIFKEKKDEVFDANYNYKGPALIFTYILLIILLMCSATYITTILKRIYFYLTNLLKK